MLLSELGGESLAELSTEIEKLLLYVGERKDISAPDVKETLSFRRAVSTWKFSECLEKGDFKEAAKILQVCLQQGEDHFRLLHLLAQSVRQKMSCEDSGQPRSDPSRLLRALKNADLSLKSGEKVESACLEQFLVSFQKVSSRHP